MKKIVISLLFVLVIKTVFAEFKVVGYIPTYRSMYNNASSVPYDKLTHINVSFMNSGTSGELLFASVASLDALVTKAHEKGVKVLISIGGAGAPSYSAVLASTTIRNTFVSNLTRFAVDHDLDGYDIDLEGDNITADYETFVLQMRDSMNVHNLLLTAALAQWNGSNVSNNALNAFDFLNIMAYDRTGDWNPNNPGQHSSFDDALSDRDYWVKTRGLSEQKAILGVPFYGYEFRPNNTATSWRYADIVSTYSGAENFDEIGNTIYYNGLSTIEDKTKLAAQKGGGVMIWEITQDSNDPKKSLLDVIHAIRVVGIDDSKEGGFSLFPSVTQNKLNCKIKGGFELNIIDSMGELKMAINGEDELNIDVSELIQGTYIVQVVSEKGVAQSKFIKN